MYGNRKLERQLVTIDRNNYFFSLSKVLRNFCFFPLVEIYVCPQSNTLASSTGSYPNVLRLLFERNTLFRWYLRLKFQGKSYFFS